MRTELDDTERAILYWMSHGCTNDAIGRKPDVRLTEGGVRARVTMIFGKLRAVNRAQAVRRGFEKGLLATEDAKSRTS